MDWWSFQRKTNVFSKHEMFSLKSSKNTRCFFMANSRNRTCLVDLYLYIYIYITIYILIICVCILYIYIHIYICVCVVISYIMLSPPIVSGSNSSNIVTCRCTSVLQPEWPKAATFGRAADSDPSSRSPPPSRSPREWPPLERTFSTSFAQCWDRTRRRTPQQEQLYTRIPDSRGFHW